MNEMEELRRIPRPVAFAPSPNGDVKADSESAPKESSEPIIPWVAPDPPHIQAYERMAKLREARVAAMNQSFLARVESARARSEPKGPPRSLPFPVGYDELRARPPAAPPRCKIVPDDGKAKSVGPHPLTYWLATTGRRLPGGGF